MRSFQPCYLKDYRTLRLEPNRIFQFRRGGEKAGCILIVMLWPPDSEIIYYRDSVRRAWPTVAADNGLWRVPGAALKEKGCGEESIRLKHGGL